MKKLFILLSFLACSCASNYKYYNLKENAVIPNEYKIYVRNVNVQLKEEKLSSESSSTKYPDQEQLNKIFKELIIS